MTIENPFFEETVAAEPVAATIDPFEAALAATPEPVTSVVLVFVGFIIAVVSILDLALTKIVFWIFG